MKLSIVIPTYEGMDGSGPRFLLELLQTIYTYNIDTSEYEVIISDQSKDDVIKNICLYEQTIQNTNIVYHKSDAVYPQSARNLNNGLKLAKGEFIKILFQDDLLYHPKALEIIYTSIISKPKYSWGVCGYNYTDENGEDFVNPKLPAYTPYIIQGINTIGSPSVIFLRNKNIEYFDENMLWLVDCEYYYRLNKKFGPPLVIDEILMTNRLHSGGFSHKNKDEKELTKKDLEYIWRKYASNTTV